MGEKKSIYKLLYLNLTSCFISIMMAITLTGMLFVGPETVHEGLFQLGEGLTFESIMQIFLWSCVLSGLTVALASDVWLGKLMLLWRMAILICLAAAVSVGFAIVFRWFPPDAWEVWVTFLLFFTIGFGGGLVAAVVKTRREDNRYNALLSEYKSKKGGASDDSHA